MRPFRSYIVSPIKKILPERHLDSLRKIIRYIDRYHYDLTQLGRLFGIESKKLFSGLIPFKPETLNLLVTNECNSHCIMCNIWKSKNTGFISSHDLAAILSDPLFQRLKYVGISGGEPTLRDDLPDIVRALCCKRPLLKGLGVITNGIDYQQVRMQIHRCHDICTSYGVPFNVMVSLDGLEETHDTNRGTPHNFETAISLLEDFHTNNLTTSFACTITTANANSVDELLEYAMGRQWYGRFRIAEFMERLSNTSCKVIRVFDRKTLYHLALFFFRLQYEYERNPDILKSYKNIQQMLSERHRRSIGCPYQRNAVVLTAHGELLYCSPHSPTIGNALNQSAMKIYRANIHKRRHIKAEFCDQCIHDYHDSFSLSDYVKVKLSLQRKKKYALNALIRKSWTVPSTNPSNARSFTRASENALIIGWYGTETAGDKAILWSVVQKLKKRPKPPSQIFLSSLFPFVTQNTLEELGLEDLKIVETYSRNFEKAIKHADEIIVGGGPLMDIHELDHILYAFLESSNDTLKRVEGCGLGPLHNPQYISAVAEILRLANEISVRDSASHKFCINEFGILPSSVKQVDDPSVDYVSWINNNILTVSEDTSDTKKYLSCFLREWEYTYSQDISKEEFSKQKEVIESQLAELITYLSHKYTSGIKLLPMHSFWVGGDDRIFNRKMARKLREMCPLDFYVEPEILPLSPKEIISHMKQSELNICMRFHSVVFAETLHVPYIAIDYTKGGKIRNFLKDKGKLNKMLSLEDIMSGDWERTIDSISTQ